MTEFLILSTVLDYLQRHNYIGPVEIIERLTWWPGGPPYLVRIRLGTGQAVASGWGLIPRELSK